MALTEIQKAQVDKRLTAYCAKRVPAHVRSQVRVGYRIDGNAVILYEERPAFRPPHDWQEMVVAKFTWWHAYRALPVSSSFVKLLEEVDADPTGIFWG